MTSSPKDPRRNETSFGQLREQLREHLEPLRDAAKERERQAAELRAQREAKARLLPMSEAQFMALIFETLGDEAEALDLDRIVVCRAGPTREDLPSEGESLPGSPPESHGEAGSPELASTEPRRTEPRRTETSERARSPLEAHHWIGRHWRDIERPLAASDLQSPSLLPGQADLLRRVREPLTGVNLRYLPWEQAKPLLRSFVALGRARGERFLRVVTGKGIQSAGEAVLKPAVIEWCRTDASRSILDWAPELDADGEFGSLILELRSARR